MSGFEIFSLIMIVFLVGWVCGLQDEQTKEVRPPMFIILYFTICIVGFICWVTCKINENFIPTASTVIF